MLRSLTLPVPEITPLSRAHNRKPIKWPGEVSSELTPEQFMRAAVFEGYGALTLRSLAHYLCSHDQQHLAGLQWLLGKIEASRAQSGRREEC